LTALRPKIAKEYVLPTLDELEEIDKVLVKHYDFIEE